MSLKAIEEKLPMYDFIRVHRSFIVAFDKIDLYTKVLSQSGGRKSRSAIITRIAF